MRRWGPLAVGLAACSPSSPAVSPDTDEPEPVGETQGDDTDDTDDGEDASDAISDTDTLDTESSDAPGGETDDTDVSPTPRRARRIVLGGDSWSSGFIQPLRDAMDADGFADVALSWELSSYAGTRASDWVANQPPPVPYVGPPMLDGLAQTLDATPAADVLVLVLTGNDLNSKAADGLGSWPGFLQKATLDDIVEDLESLVVFARLGRPELDVVIVGYDFLHFEFLDLLVLSLDGFDRISYNQILVDLERRKKSLAARSPRVHYAHNLGLLQHVHGDTLHPPFPVPNPLIGYPEYPPGFAPAPGVFPTYQPFPGGLPTYPAPLTWMPDGIHPSADGFRTLADHLLDQGLAGLLDGSGWQPR